MLRRHRKRTTCDHSNLSNSNNNSAEPVQVDCCDDDVVNECDASESSIDDVMMDGDYDLEELYRDLVDVIDVWE